MRQGSLPCDAKRSLRRALGSGQCRSSGSGPCTSPLPTSALVSEPTRTGAPTPKVHPDRINAVYLLPGVRQSTTCRNGYLRLQCACELSMVRSGPAVSLDLRTTRRNVEESSDAHLARGMQQEIISIMYGIAALRTPPGADRHPRLVLRR